MQTEATFRYAADWDGGPIPTRSLDGTLTAYMIDPENVKIEIYAPQPISKGVVSLTLGQAREMIAQLMLIEKIIETNAEPTQKEAP
jgi:hypothetical protein